MDWAHPRIIPVKIWPDFNVLTVQYMYSQIKTHLKILSYAPTLIISANFPFKCMQGFEFIWAFWNCNGPKNLQGKFNNRLDSL